MKHILESISQNIARKDFAIYDFWLNIRKIENPKISFLASAFDYKNLYYDIEYNPEIAKLGEPALYDYFMLETMRLMLGHTVQRIIKPDYGLLFIASNLTLLNTLKLEYPFVLLDFPGYKAYGLKKVEESLEEWYKELKKLPKSAFPSKGNEGEMKDESNSKSDFKDMDGEKSAKSMFYYESGSECAKSWENGNEDIIDQAAMNHKEAMEEYISKFTEEKLKACSTIKTDNACREILSQQPTSSYNNTRILLKRFIRCAEDDKKEDTVMRVNRRFDLDAPGYKNKNKNKLIIGIDTSGSLMKSELIEFKRIMMTLTNISEADSVSWSDSVKEDTLKKFSELKKNHDIIVTGGGTYPEAFIEWAVEKKYTAAVILTDGDFYSELAFDPRIKIAWVVTKTDKYLGQWNNVYYIDDLS